MRHPIVLFLLNAPLYISMAPAGIALMLGMIDALLRCDVDALKQAIERHIDSTVQIYRKGEKP